MLTSRNSLQPLQNDVEAALRKMIETRAGEIIDQEMHSIKERVAGRVREEVGAIAARVLSKFTYEQFGTTLRIEVQFAFPESKPSS